MSVRRGSWIILKAEKPASVDKYHHHHHLNPTLPSTESAHNFPVIYSQWFVKSLDNTDIRACERIEEYVLLTTSSGRNPQVCFTTCKYFILYSCIMTGIDFSYFIDGVLVPE